MLADRLKCEKVAGEVLADGLNREKVAGEVLADGLKQEKVAGEVLADGLKREKVAGRGSADGLKQEKVAGRGSADGLKQEKVAGRGSADGLKRKRSPEEAPPMDKHDGIVVARCSPLIFRAVYRRKRARRRTKTENTSRKAHFWRGFSAEYAKKMAFLAFGLRNPTFFYYFCG